MVRDPERTRTALLDAAEALILDRGLSATTVQEISREAGLTKGAFFHHFSDKDELAHALMVRFAEADLEQLETNVDRAEQLSDDPLQQLLILVAFYEQKMERLEEPYPGCLFASYCYEADVLSERTLAVPRRTMKAWRKRLLTKLEAAAELRAPRRQVNLEALADMLTVVFEGAYVVSRTLRETETVKQQLAHYRTYLELLFAEAA